MTDWRQYAAQQVPESFRKPAVRHEAAQEPAASVATSKRAGGRVQHIAGEMNGLEKRYAAYLDMRKLMGEILDWKFEPLKLKLAPVTFWTPDFALQMLDRTIELHETKGHWEDDARVKIKWAAKDFGHLFRIVGIKKVKGTKDQFEYEVFS